MIEAEDVPTAHRRASHRLRWILGAVAAVLLILILVHLFKRKPAASGPAPQLVKVAQATQGDMPETLSELGTVTPIATVTVLPQLSGYLTEVAYKEGEDVAKGQFLAEIDPRQYEIDLQQAQAALLKDQATLDQARADLARYEQLRGQKAIAEQTVIDQEFLVKQDEAQVKSDEANIAQFKLDLVYCHITAPVAGRVGLRLIDPGNYVTAASSPGSSTSCRATSGWSEVLPNSMLMSWPGSCPMVSPASATRTSNRPLDCSAIVVTRPTICARTNSSSMAATGISTLCSIAMARARSSIERASPRT